MLRFLVIIGIISWVFYKIGSFFFRAGAAAQELKNFRHHQQSNGKASKKGQKANVKGGEYVDYEEIK